MNIEITIDESDMRAAILNHLQSRYPKEVVDYFGNHNFEVKTTYRANESWRRPTYLRLRVNKTANLVK